MSKFTYQEQMAILEKAYVSVADIKKLVPMGEKQAYALVNEILEDMESNNIPIFKCRPKLVPTKYVIEKLKIDVRHTLSCNTKYLTELFLGKLVFISQMLNIVCKITTHIYTPFLKFNYNININFFDKFINILLTRHKLVI